MNGMFVSEFSSPIMIKDNDPAVQDRVLLKTQTNDLSLSRSKVTGILVVLKNILHADKSHIDNSAIWSLTKVRAWLRTTMLFLLFSHRREKFKQKPEIRLCIVVIDIIIVNGETSIFFLLGETIPLKE